MSAKDLAQSGVSNKCRIWGHHYELASESCVPVPLLKIRASLKWQNKRHVQYLETTEESVYTEAFMVPKAVLESSC